MEQRQPAPDQSSLLGRFFTRQPRALLIISVVLLIIALGGLVTWLTRRSAGPDNRDTKVPGPSFSTTTQVKEDKGYPVSASAEAEFELQQRGPHFSVYFHTGDEMNAGKTVQFLNEVAAPLYTIHLGLSPNDIRVFLTTTAQEYIERADFPGGAQNVQVGDGSVPTPDIYYYRPFERADTEEIEPVLAHEGTHATLRQYLGEDRFAALPSFLNEGIAHYVEYIHGNRADFDPVEETGLEEVVEETGKGLQPLEQLATLCQGYVADQAFNELCRAQGTYAVWLLVNQSDRTAINRFLTELKSGKDWQVSWQIVSGKTPSDFTQAIKDDLERR